MWKSYTLNTCHKNMSGASGAVYRIADVVADFALVRSTVLCSDGVDGQILPRSKWLASIFNLSPCDIGLRNAGPFATQSHFRSFFDDLVLRIFDHSWWICDGIAVVVNEIRPRSNFYMWRTQCQWAEAVVWANLRWVKHMNYSIIAGDSFIKNTAIFTTSRTHRSVATEVKQILMACRDHFVFSRTFIHKLITFFWFNTQTMITLIIIIMNSEAPTGFEPII